MNKKSSTSILNRPFRKKTSNTSSWLRAIKRLKILGPSLKSYPFTITALQPKKIKANQQTITFPKNRHPNKSQKVLFKVMKRMKMFRFHACWSQAIKIALLVLILRMKSLKKIRHLILLKQKALEKVRKWKKIKNVKSVHNRESNPNSITNRIWKSAK